MEIPKYPASYLYTMVTELLHELNLSNRYTVKDVRSFGYVPSGEELDAGIFLEVFTRDANGVKTGTERIVRWIDHDISYEDWGKPPTYD